MPWIDPPIELPLKPSVRTVGEAKAMTAAQVLGDRKWPAHFTTDQMRGQLEHEAAGCPPPWPGARWNGYCYVR